MEITKVTIQASGHYRVNDSISVPISKDNPYYQSVLEWIDAGNTPTPYVEPEVPYQDKRFKAYGHIGDQLDMQYWDAVNGTTVWKDHIAKVKSDIPK